MSHIYETRYTRRRRPSHVAFLVMGVIAGTGLGAISSLVMTCPSSAPLHRLNCVAYEVELPEIVPGPYGMIKTTAKTLRTPSMVCAEVPK